MTAGQQNGSSTRDGSATNEIRAPLDIGIAIHANDPDAVPAILQRLSDFGKTPDISIDDTRVEMLANARALVRALETPRETMIKHNWAQPGCHAAITTLYQAGVFQVLGNEPVTVEEMASELGKPRETLSRLMRHVAAMGYVLETGPDEYTATNFSKALTIPIIGDGYSALSGGCLQSCSKFAEYMQKTNYEVPSNAKAGPYQYAFDTELNMFEYLHEHPPLGKQFDHHMGGYRQGRPSWMDPDFFPVQERLIEGMDATQNDLLLVDIGGGFGHDLEEFRAKFPDAPGRLVLQDLTFVIEGIQHLDPKIERMEYDFHKKQPLQAARAYYMHSVLHDWPNNVCHSILKQIVGAMKRGYSKLLINENVIPDQGADWQATALDIMMMTLFASKERTSSAWSQLLESPEIGLKIVRIWSVKHSQESLIECELA